MKTHICLLVFLLNASTSLCQTLLSGSVSDDKGDPLIGVNVFVKNSYDGATTDAEGKFQFTSVLRDTITIVASLIGYETGEKTLLRGSDHQAIHIAIKELATELDAVTITAGTFEASDEKRQVVLKAMDILTTAGSSGDVFTAVQTLPGVQRVGNSEGLFVRGGSSSEARTLIDGSIVENPFYSSVPDVSQRSRFSPAMFKGTSFSTGGYSAQYGQALSSVMALETNDLPDSSLTGIALTIGGLSLTEKKRWKRMSVSFDGTYSNLGPLFKVVPQHTNWQQAPVTGGSTLSFRYKPTENSILKIMGYHNRLQSALFYQDFNSVEQQNLLKLNNNNVYFNGYYKNVLRDGKWIVTGSTSYSNNKDVMSVNTNPFQQFQERLQTRATALRSVGENSSVLVGGEIHRYSFGKNYNGMDNTVTDIYSSGFAEAEIYVSKKLAAKIGARLEHSSLLGRTNVAPRLSMAYKTGESSQVSFAYGQFYQSPENRYLFSNKSLNFEKATHYILNYQHMKNNRTFRVEAYLKDYKNLVKETNVSMFNPSLFYQPGSATNNQGSGRANGIDVFWRDKKSIKNGDFWVSYSLLDTKRDYQNFLSPAVPSFASRHNLNVVYKHYVPSLSTYFGMTYALASGRPYYNPNSEKFLADYTRAYSNLSINANFITSICSNFVVVFASVSNVFGTKNVFGYRYSMDSVSRTPILQAADRTFFLGAYISLHHKSKK